MAYSKNELWLRQAAWGVTAGLFVGAILSASIENTHGYYWWQVELIGGELISSVVLAVALLASHEKFR